MRTDKDNNASKKRPINLTIREDVLAEAKKLRLNTSKAAEDGIIRAVKEALAQQWLADNKQSLLAHNNRVDAHGTLLTPSWSE